MIEDKQRGREGDRESRQRRARGEEGWRQRQEWKNLPGELPRV